MAKTDKMIVPPIPPKPSIKDPKAATHAKIGGKPVSAVKSVPRKAPVKR